MPGSRHERIIRGKVFPAQKFLKSERDDTLRIPSSIYVLTVTGEYAEAEKDERTVLGSRRDPAPDLATIRVAPRLSHAHRPSSSPTAIAATIRLTKSRRACAEDVVALYEARGWSPVVAPELEFYLTQINPDPDLPLMPPAGRSGRSETAPQPYGLEPSPNMRSDREHL